MSSKQKICPPKPSPLRIALQVGEELLLAATDLKASAVAGVHISEP